jgi:uncharacterized membrane protein
MKAMKKPAGATSIAVQRFKTVLTILLWAVIVGFSLYFFLDNVVGYLFGYRSRIFGDPLFNNQLWVVLHLVGGSMALLLGPVQFWPIIRRRFLNIHRSAGKVYLLGVVLIGIRALRLSLVSVCVPCRISLFLLKFFTLLATWFAWKATKVRDYTTVQNDK